MTGTRGTPGPASGRAPGARDLATAAIVAAINLVGFGVLAKLGLRDRVAAVIWAYEVGLVQPGDVPRGSGSMS